MSDMTYTVADAVKALDEVFPLSTQDGWDNSGLLVGDASDPLKGVLLAVDLTEEVVGEAAELGCNLVVAHHPIMFRGLKRLTGATAEQRAVIKAIKLGISLAAFHTPADKSVEGTSGSVARLLGLSGLSVLAAEDGALCKIVTYVPPASSQAVADAMSAAGAGHVGNYSHCSWTGSGMGQYQAQPGAHPFAGSIGKLHFEAEDRVEAICTRRLARKVREAIVAEHPYEEPAIDVLPLLNSDPTVGYGVVGELESDLPVADFLEAVKTRLGCQSIRYAGRRHTVRRVAICTGSGAEFIPAAGAAGADAYITADVKYHQMADAAQDVMIVDIGHYESEKITKCVFKGILTRKLANFARYELSREANPIKYY